MADPTWNDPSAQPLSVVPPDEWGGWLNDALAEFAGRTKLLREESVSGLEVVDGALVPTFVDGTVGTPTVSLTELFNASTPGSAADGATAANVSAGELTRAALANLVADPTSELAVAVSTKIAEEAGEDSTPTYETIPAGSVIVVRKVEASWPPRPTTRTDIRVVWEGAEPSPPIVTTGTGGMYSGDVRDILV